MGHADPFAPQMSLARIPVKNWSQAPAEPRGESRNGIRHHFLRVEHSTTLAVRKLEYLESARALGASAVRIVAQAILPTILAPILVQASLAAGHAILLESGLSFLGLGPPPPAPSWGRMVEQSGRYRQHSVLPLLWPSAAISMTGLAFTLLGDGLRDLLDPRLRS